MGCSNVMEMPVVFLLLLHLSLNGPEESQAVNPGCTCLVFSQTYGKDRGTFSSPDYPKNYPRGIDCLLFTFIAGPDQIVELTFADFDVHKTHMDCMRGDYLKLYPHVERGEVSEYSEGAGVLCGGRSAAPPALYSSARAFVLEFHSAPGKPANATGFLGYFRFIDRKLFQTDGEKETGTMCDYDFTSAEHSRTHGRFYSPRYPSSYPRNIKCSYRFRARLKERIRITFEEVTLQKGDLSCLNRADIIKVFDGENNLSPTITVLCNEGSEIEVLSTGSDLCIEFIANSEFPGQGFKASFQFQPLEEASGSDGDKIIKLLGNQKTYTVIGPEVSATTSSCDAIFNSDSGKEGILSSPHHPSPYPPRSHCRYDFQGRGKERVQIVFHDLSLYHPDGDNKECESTDALQAFVHLDGRMEKLESYCGSILPRPIMSNGPRLMLEFRGIYSARNVRGFKASYIFTENYGITGGKQLSEFPCGFVFNSSEARNGSFSSPNYPGPYPRDTECHYFFHGSPHQKVHLHFTYFDVEGVLPCESISASDYVEFSNSMARDKKFNRHCGQLREFHVESDRKFFRVTFRSNDRLDATGFTAKYQFLNEVESYTIQPENTDSSSANGSVSIFILVFPYLLTIFNTFSDRLYANSLKRLLA